jgi:hypothetical protein
MEVPKLNKNYLATIRRNYLCNWEAILIWVRVGRYGSAAVVHLDSSPMAALERIPDPSGRDFQDRVPRRRPSLIPDVQKL